MSARTCQAHTTAQPRATTTARYATRPKPAWKKTGASFALAEASAAEDGRTLPADVPPKQWLRMHELAMREPIAKTCNKEE